MKTTYILKLSNKKYLRNILRYQVKIRKIEYQNDICFLYVDSINYYKLTKYFNLYDISVYDIKGLLYYKNLLISNLIFIISIIVGIIFWYTLSNIIFDVKILSNNGELIKIIQSELNEANIKKYHLVKSFKEKEIIKNKILKDYPDKIEWLEIERRGSVYYINVLERIINKDNNTSKYQNIISRKNAVIKEIKASNGQIVKKINDYVNKGDVIISGNIMKDDEIKEVILAKGKVYGETWYIVKVELPRTYQDMKYTGNSYNRFSLNIFNKRYFLFKNKKYNNEEYQDNVIINNTLLPFSLNKTKIMEVNKTTFFFFF